MDGPYVATGYLSYHPAFNTEMITEEELPTEWEGYCEPEWKGKFAIDQEGGEWATGIPARRTARSKQRATSRWERNRSRPRLANRSRTRCTASGWGRPER